MQKWDRAFREDYKRRGYDLDKDIKKETTETEKERLKKLYEW